jgi:hypothetical protein
VVTFAFITSPCILDVARSMSESKLVSLIGVLYSEDIVAIGLTLRKSCGGSRKDFPDLVIQKDR